MIVKPMVRNNICLNAHPQGCKKGVEDQIEYTKKRITAEVKAGVKAPKMCWYSAVRTVTDLQAA